MLNLGVNWGLSNVDGGLVVVWLAQGGFKLVLIHVWKCSNTILKRQEWPHFSLTKTAKLATLGSQRMKPFYSLLNSIRTL